MKFVKTFENWFDALPIELEVIKDAIWEYVNKLKPDIDKNIYAIRELSYFKKGRNQSGRFPEFVVQKLGISRMSIRILWVKFNLIILD